MKGRRGKRAHTMMKMRSRSPSLLSWPSTWSAWLLFTVLALSNCILAYSGISFFLKALIAVLGLLWPLGAAFIHPAGPLKGKRVQDPGSGPSAFLWILLIILAIGIRSYRLTTLAPWPLHDEAMHSYLALELDLGEKPRMFYTFSQFPPFYIWGLALFFKSIQPSLAALWLFPFLISLATVGLGFLAARAFLGGRRSFWTFLFLAFGFWPLLQGRFSHAGVLVLLWEVLAFAAAGMFWKARPGTLSKVWLTLFGIVTGAGFYVFTSWAAVALSLTALAFLLADGKGLTQARTALGFLTPLFLLAAPYFFFLVLDHPMGNYVSSLLPSLASPDALWDQARTSTSYFTSLLWGSLRSSFYCPNWGGFLNPVLGSLCLLGLRNLLTGPRSPFILWGIGSFFLMMLPGVLTSNVELFRVIQVLPLLLVPAAFGLEALWTDLPGPRRAGVIVPLLALSLSLDLFHLFVVCPRAWSPGGAERYREQGLRFYSFGPAYKALERIAREQGPGLVLTDLLWPPDPSLIVTTYPFNAALNPRLAGQEPAWEAFWTNQNDLPFLRKRFPQARTLVLPEGEGDVNGAWALVVLDRGPRTDPFFTRLGIANRAMEAVRKKTLRLNFQEGHQAILADLYQAYPYFKGDPLLENLFWRSAYLHYSADRRFGGALLSLLQVLKTGYPAADLYCELGYYRYLQGRLADAKDCFEKALRMPESHTSALKDLEIVDQAMAKTGSHH